MSVFLCKFQWLRFFRLCVFPVVNYGHTDGGYLSRSFPRICTTSDVTNGHRPTCKSENLTSHPSLSIPRRIRRCFLLEKLCDVTMGANLNAHLFNLYNSYALLPLSRLVCCCIARSTLKIIFILNKIPITWFE